MDRHGEMGVEEVSVLRCDVWCDGNGGELGVVLVECKSCECNGILCTRRFRAF